MGDSVNLLSGERAATSLIRPIVEPTRGRFETRLLSLRLVDPGISRDRTPTFLGREARLPLVLYKDYTWSEEADHERNERCAARLVGSSDNAACGAAKVAATNTVNNGAVMSIFAKMLTFDRKSGEQWKSPIPVSTSCKAEILKTLSNDTLMLTDFRASLLRAGCSNPSK